MSDSASAGAPEVARQRRFGPMLAAFVLGLPIGAGLIWLLSAGPLRDSFVHRYVEHPAEQVLLVLFGSALGAFLGKWVGIALEQAALLRQVLPRWTGDSVPVADAGKLLTDLQQQPGWVRSTLLSNRIVAVLKFLTSRRSANELDDQLRCLADADVGTVEGSYSLTRFITWALPILGFLGTVLGITAAISGVSPDQLEQNIGQVTGGLAEAFDATALALSLTMIVMFIGFVVERLEYRVLGRIDRYVEDELAHRFERTGSVGGELVEVLRGQGDSLLKTTELLVQRQAAVWSKALDEGNARRREVEADFKKQLAAALETALERTLEAHARRMSEMEKQVNEPTARLVDKLTVLGKTAEGLTRQAELLARLQEGERQLVQLQQVLQQNLASLADAGAFQQAVHSLTAAIHLLTAQVSVPAALRRPGVAA